MSKKKISAGKLYEQQRLKAKKEAAKLSRTKVFSLEEQIAEVQSKRYTGRNAAKRFLSRLMTDQKVESIKDIALRDQAKEIEELKRQLEEANKKIEEAQKKEEERKAGLKVLQDAIRNTDWNNANPEDIVRYNAPKDWLEQKTGYNPNNYSTEELLGEGEELL